MKWSLRIGWAFGIAIYMHFTFPLILLYIGWRSYALTEQISAALYGVFVVCAIFGIVVLHELGHALTARRFGIATRDIVLLPIGGVARLERIPDDPRQELVIAVAGPAVNVVLAIICFAILAVLGQAPGLMQLLSPGDGFVSNMLSVNLTLILFNAIPAFPMDGGRVLRSLLAMRMDYARATGIAAGLGKAFAVLFGIGGWLYWDNPLLVVIAVFVWLGASSEAAMARFKSDVGGADSTALVIRDVYALSPDDPLEKAIDGVLAGFQQDFPVVSEGKLVGLLTREDLLKGVNSVGRTGRVADAMRRQFPTAEEGEGIDSAFAKLQDAGLRTLPVVSGGVLVGVITTENIAEFLMVRAALRGSERGRSAFVTPL